jgi:hypothetical protein
MEYIYNSTVGTTLLVRKPSTMVCACAAALAPMVQRTTQRLGAMGWSPEECMS